MLMVRQIKIAQNLAISVKKKNMLSLHSKRKRKCPTVGGQWEERKSRVSRYSEKMSVSVGERMLVISVEKKEKKKMHFCL